MTQVINLPATRVVIAMLVLLSACADEKPGTTSAVPSDAWINPPPLPILDAEVIPESAYHLVPNERLAEATEFLGSESISQISPGEIKYFAGKPVGLPGVTRPFLIRAAYRSTPKFTIRILDNAFWVTSHDDPKDSAPVVRQPLLLVMEEVPETVHVTVGKP